MEGTASGGTGGLKPGLWLGVDLGSRRDKIASFCLIEASGDGGIRVGFERGQAGAPYPKTNSRADLLDLDRGPTYLRAEIEKEVRRVAADAELVRRWAAGDLPKAVSIDAPVALAAGEGCRLTEKASTDTFTTPTRERFEELLATKGDPYLRVNAFWKCVGFTFFRHFAEALGAPAGAAQEEVASWTCGHGALQGAPLQGAPLQGALRETFPSDVYKRSHGAVGVPSAAARRVLAAVAEAPWQAAGSAKRRERGRGAGRPAASTLHRLEALRDELAEQLEARDAALEVMRKRPGTVGDLWDAFTCAATACCESHGAAVLHGWDAFAAERDRLLREGAILTVATAS
ncbi:MAG: hypothetical protein AAF725_20210 [Acidobacteriota bacterium]